ncbi:MAG TPA: BadF/BadG/BcrA/BcrD ATPase family protein, partial [Dehalococcoidales bacterium]|nr:BadF/BadG/BcrA/BcrD ATPase family protein [Dehalococcoidales bacterium]
MKYSLGIDIGSVNAKISVVDSDKHVVHTDIEKISSGPRAAVNSLLSRAQQKGFLKDAVSAGITGSVQGVVPVDWGWKEYGTALSIASGLLQSQPDTATIIQIGGQSSLVIELNDGLNQPWKVVSNPLCAAGTGRFIEQQAYRLGIGLDNFSRIAMEHKGAAPRIAARCSVFAKTDLIHLQQKGAPLSAMLYALCESIARMIVTLKKGPFNPPVYFVGGVAANAAVTRALSEAITERNGKPTRIIVPKDFLYIEATGAAVLASGSKSKIALIPGADEVKNYYELPALGYNGASSLEFSTSSTSLSTCGFMVSLVEPREIESEGYLGVDVGST